MASEPYYDIIVVGAGISGIGAGYHIQKYCPNKSFCILEGRETIGGTWDLFKYPGIRSDSSMETMGYSFKPWQGKQSISDGKYILQYMHETVEEYDLMKYIKCNHMLKEMHFDSVSCIWNLHVTQNQTQPMKVSTSNSTQLNMKCSFVLLCTGYYDYEAGYTPSFVGSHLFKGDIIHPQHWPEGFDYKNKRIAIIGSGATAVTLLPVLAQEAKHVTMVQRSPTYIASVPAADPFVYLTRSLFPKNIAGFLNRWYSILTNVLFYYVCVSFPKYTKSILQYLIKADVGCDNAYIQKHFNPK